MASMCSFSLPSLASSSPFSFPSMLACARTLYNVLVCCSNSTISCNMVLSAWLLCIVGCFICVLITYSPLSQFVNMCAAFLGYSSFLIFRVPCFVMNFALKIFCGPSSLTASSKQLDLRKNKKDMSNV